MRLIKIAIACNILTIIICLSLDSIIVLKIEIVLFGLQVFCWHMNCLTKYK